MAKNGALPKWPYTFDFMPSLFSTGIQMFIYVFLCGARVISTGPPS
jgi:hypothetical protein